jgi:hypothetical protein
MTQTRKNRSLKKRLKRTKCNKKYRQMPRRTKNKKHIRPTKKNRGKMCVISGGIGKGITSVGLNALDLLNNNIGKIDKDYNIFYDVKYVIDTSYLNDPKNHCKKHGLLSRISGVFQNNEGKDSKVYYKVGDIVHLKEAWNKDLQYNWVIKTVNGKELNIMKKKDGKVDYKVVSTWDVYKNIYSIAFCNTMEKEREETKKLMDQGHVKKKTIFGRFGRDAHRAKVRGSPLMNVNLLAAMFVTSMQILLCKDENPHITALKELATVLIKIFFVNIDESERKKIIKNSLSFEKIKIYKGLFENIKSESSVEEEPIITLEDAECIRKLDEIAHSAQTNTLRLEEVRLLLMYGTQSNKGALARIGCLVKVGAWMGLDNINVVLGMITGLAGGATVCPYMLIPLIFVIMKLATCILDIKLPSVISIAVIGFTGVPDFDLSSLKSLAKTAGNAFKDIVTEVDEAFEDAGDTLNEKIIEVEEINEVEEKIKNEINEFIQEDSEGSEKQLELEQVNEDEKKTVTSIIPVIPPLSSTQKRKVKNIEERITDEDSKILAAQAEIKKSSERFSVWEKSKQIINNMDDINTASKQIGELIIMKMSDMEMNEDKKKAINNTVKNALLAANCEVSKENCIKDAIPIIKDLTNES